MKVPFLDLGAHHEPLRAEISVAIDKLIDGSCFVGGEQVSSFERDFARLCGTTDAVGVGSGTDALWLSLMASGVGPGDEVITVPMTFVATVEAILRVGATPVLVDICPVTYTLDPEKLEGSITSRTKAIVPVHLFGQVADMGPILEVGERHGLVVIEDAAQAHGAEYLGKRAGSLGGVGCFSFYPGKNLGAFGEAGAITSNDSSLCERIRSLGNHGQAKKYRHQTVGWNSRLDTIQAAVLSVKLRHLDSSNLLRRKHALRYEQGLAGLDGVLTPASTPDRRHVFHVYAIRVGCRNRVLERMKDRGVECGVHYPIPVHLQPGYRSLGYQEGDFPVAEACASEFLSLPIFPELSEAQIDFVVSSLQELAARGVAA